MFLHIIKTTRAYKFWWSEELSCLKENAIQSNEIWKAAGRPRTGPIEPILRNIRDVVMHYLPLKKLLNILLRRVVKYIVPLSMRQKDKVLHNGLFVKLLKRNVSVRFVYILRNWYSKLSTSDSQ